MQARVDCGVPLWSSHDASTMIITGERGSGIALHSWEHYRQELETVEYQLGHGVSKSVRKPSAGEGGKEA